MRHNRIFGQRELIALVAITAAVPFAGVSAQRPAAPPPRLMVTTFAGSEAGLGVQAAEAVRSRISKDMDEKKLQVITKKDIDLTLGASGYPTTEPLGPNDARALAVLLRADEYVEGTATKTPTGVRVESRLVLARDNTLQQPLPTAEVAKLDQAAQMISKSYQAARGQLENERACATLFRDGKFKEAEQAARAGLTKFPGGTIAGVCLGNALNAQKQTDSVLAVAKRILAVDPHNISALRWAADIYKERKDTLAIPALMALVAADPNNEKTRDQVVNDLAATGQASRAKPIIQDAIKNNPGDPKLLRTGWLVYLAAKEYDLAVATGAELIKVDTSAADTTYFIRTGGAMAAQNQFQKAADIYGQGLAKFPGSATLLISQANALGKAGNNAAAVVAAQRAVQINPRIENGYAQLALLYGATSQPEQVLATIRAGVAAGADKTTLAKIALSEGQKSYKAGNASKNRADFQRAIQFLQLSDQLEGTPSAKFLMGVSAFSLGQNAITEAQGTKSCVLARMAKDAFAMAQENVPAGLPDFPDAAKQVLTAIPQFTPATDDMVKRFCK